MLQAQEKGLSEILKEIKKVYCKAFPFIRQQWNAGILSTYKKVISKLDAEIKKFNRNYNFKLTQAISLKFNINYKKAKKAAVKN